LRCHELATSPHSFPAFGLLATLGCMISSLRLYWIELATKQQSSLRSPIFARRISSGEHYLCVNPTPLDCCHVVKGISLITD